MSILSKAKNKIVELVNNVKKAVASGYNSAKEFLTGGKAPNDAVVAASKEASGRVKKIDDEADLDSSIDLLPLVRINDKKEKESLREFMSLINKRVKELSEIIKIENLPKEEKARLQSEISFNCSLRTMFETMFAITLSEE
jgi:hypothetical protein